MSVGDKAGMICPLSPMLSMAKPSKSALPATGRLLRTALVPGVQNLTWTGRTIPLAGVVLSDPRRRGMLRTESGHEKGRIAKNARAAFRQVEVLRLREEGSLRWKQSVKDDFCANITQIKNVHQIFT